METVDQTLDERLDNILDNEELLERFNDIYTYKPHLDLEEKIEYHEKTSFEVSSKIDGVSVSEYGHMLSAVKCRIEKIKLDHCE